MASDSDKLTRRQSIALAALVAGSSVTDAAAAAGVHRNSVTKWLQLPAFWQQLDDASEQSLRLASVASSDDVNEALATIRAVMTDSEQSPALRLRAAVYMLDVRLRLRDALDVATRLDELERQLKVIHGQ